MNILIVLLFVLLSLDCTEAWAQAWPNQPANSTTLLDCPFTSTNCNGAIWNVYNSGTIATDNAAPLSSPSVLDSALFPCKASYTNPPPPALGSGCSGGGEWLYPASTQSAQSLSDMYVGLWWKANAEFEQNFVGGNKLFFMRANNWLFGGTRTNGTFLASGAPSSMMIIFAPNGAGQDNSHTCGQGGFTCSPNVTTTRVAAGQWVKIEAYIKASTCDTCRNAILRWWVNGVLNGNYTNLNYGQNVINEFAIGQTWDGAGNGCCPTVPWHFYFDHVRIASGGSVTPPPPPLDNPPGPPGTVTGVTVTVQ